MKGSRDTYYWFVKWCVCWPLVRLLCRVEIKGRENLPKDGGYIIAPNHLKWYDGFILSAVWKKQISFAGKSELFERSGQRQFMALTGQISLKRENGSVSEMLCFVRQAASKMNQGLVFGIFPEGTRSLDGKLHHFENGVGVIASVTKRPILPVGISYSKNSIRLTVRIVIGTPIDSSGYRSDQLTAELRRQIAACSGQDFADDGTEADGL